MITRQQTGKLKPKVLLTEVEPSTIKQALASFHWKQAMDTEIQALTANKTWTLTTLPPNRRAIGCKWVYRVKHNADGSLNKYKARLVAKGYNQLAGTDYGETYAPVIKPTTIRILLSLAISYKWTIEQIDVKNAFINGHLEEDIYMMQPPGYVSTDKSQVCKLHRSLYGLKQAPRAWHDRLKLALKQFGFSPSRCDSSLFIHTSKGVQLFALVYVDDILITGSSPSLIQDLINKLNKEFALTKMGRPDYFLGLEFKYLPSGSVLLSQCKYIRDLLSKAAMTDCKGIATPMASTTKLSKIGSDSVQDSHQYRSIVGALQYLTLTRPEIAYSVNKVCQFLANPLTTHWQAVKRILRYLGSTSTHGLLFQPANSNSTLSLRAYTDSDWGSDPDDRRSTSGSCVYLGPNLVSWSSKKQTLVARSSAEAEYRGLANATAEILWLQSLLRELQVQHLTPILLCDNQSAVSIAHNPVLHSRTKHLELDIHFVRDRVLAKELSVLHIPASAQIADVFTKPLPSSQFLEFKSKLKVLSTSHLSFEGGILGNKSCDNKVSNKSIKCAMSQLGQSVK